MVLENYGQDYEELDVVDVDGVDDEEVLEDIEEELLDEADNSVDDEEQLEDSLLEAKAQATEDLSKNKSKGKDRSKRSKDEGDASSGEEAWLEALESGKLEEVCSFPSFAQTSLTFRGFRLMMSLKRLRIQNL